jgi:elongator complex protein 3
VTYHFMPNLPGSNTDLDFKMFKEMFNNPRWQPDQIKFYPTVVVKGSLLYNWYKKGKYHPYSDQELQDLIIKCKKLVPPYVRIIRLIRDIPAQSIIAGNKITNLRQIMQQRGVKCSCIRCREVGNLKKEKIRFNIIKYKASDGIEYFLNYESIDKKHLYAFCRLRIDKNSKIAPALIRELHVYGKLVPIGGEKKIQHSGLGKKLIFQAEKIAKKNKISKIAIISGVGVRNYYRKLAYRLEKTYLTKKI